MTDTPRVAWQGPIDRLNDRVALVERDLAVRKETLRGVEFRLGRIETVLSRLTWLMIAAILVAFMNFAISGGLQHVAAIKGL